MIRVLLADDHDVVRQGIRRLLEHDPSLEVCGEATNGREAVTMAGELRPDVAVLDLAMPELNGLDATRQMQRASPTTEVLIFTMHNTEQLVRDVVAAGARGYVLKSDPAGDLVTAVKTLAQHKPYFTPSPTAALLDIRMRARETSVDGSGVLTSREREILQLISEGKTNKETADALHISIKTVETHRAAIMRKLHVNSVVELVHYAIRNNIVQP